MLLTTKYAPKKLDDLIGNSEQVEHIKQWILHWLSGKPRKPLLIYGPPGVGKTSIAYILKDQFDLEIIEMNASELRNKDRVERVLGQSALAGSLFGRTKIVLVDDADVLAGRKDSGGGTAIKNFLAESPCPAIVTATDVWDKSLSTIRAECELLEFKKISKGSIKKHLETVAKAEQITLSPEIIDAIAERAEGDVRAALNDLQCHGPSARTHEKDIFQIVRGILKGESYAAVKELVGGDIDYDIIKLWIDENISNEYETPDDIAAGYDSLSKADIFDGRIRKTHWQMLKYSIDLATAGVAIAKKTPYRKFTKYNFPSYLKNMSRSVERRAMLKAIGIKIGKRVHVNARDAREYIPLLKEYGKSNMQKLMDFYEFSEEEIAFILETSVSKVKK
ncbi:Replication factor C large subunit [Candidatus Bilamarchaeum dharawalense]|uniref:Replication factor C large subunit n=1 Tax=Candidatus Bilamarchaeum dharawalense TaxID=2885759 RepID=A0A5E4LXE8_9ARCH|nr:Replication factor C large subunit [Candidatus Bilamarchaeum dharawalense]